MKDPVVNEALRQIEDIVAQEVGTALPAHAKERVEKVLASAIGGLGVTRRDNLLAREVTIMLADLRGFTPICNAYPTSVVLELLNRCFVRMSEVIFRHDGTIDKFTGDSILVLFESPGDARSGVRRAITCAVDMQNAMHELNELHRHTEMPEMYFGIGLNTGRVLSALLGSDIYSEYTVIGDEVNLASRIESFSLRGQVLISESTFERCDGFVKTGDAVDVFVKGRSKMVALREVLSIPSLGKVVPRQDARRSLRVDVTIPFNYRMVVNAVVVPEVRHGRILDISYHGVLAEILLPMSQFSELQVEFDLPLVGERVKSLYGKVIKVVPKAEKYRAGIEFTAMTAEHRSQIQLFVQMLIQGSESRD
ncbi:MAG: adenylate/guanylate cyclase domain-containing protein [Usitatibacter sp.]